MQRKKILMIVGGVLLVIVIGVAAFLAGRLANQSAQTDPNQPGIVMAGPDGGMGTFQSFSLEIEPAPEIPTTDPEVMGMLLSREDNVLKIGTGDASGGFAVSSSVVTRAAGAIGEGEAIEIDSMGSGEYTGPEVEVVVTKDTKIYRDATMDEFQNGGMPEGDVKLQMKVELISVDDLSDSGFITVWGRRSGDRVIADVILTAGGMMIMSVPGE